MWCWHVADVIFFIFFIFFVRYIAIMNSIFSAQRLQVKPLNTPKLQSLGCIFKLVFYWSLSPSHVFQIPDFGCCCLCFWCKNCLECLTLYHLELTLPYFLELHRIESIARFIPTTPKKNDRYPPPSNSSYTHTYHLMCMPVSIPPFILGSDTHRLLHARIATLCIPTTGKRYIKSNWIK